MTATAGPVLTRPRRPRSGGGQAVRLVVLIAIVAVVLYPLFWMIGTSVKGQEEIVSNTGLLPRQFTPATTPTGGPTSTSASAGSSSTAPWSAC